MQLDLPLCDHVDHAKALKRHVSRTQGEMFIVYASWSNKYWLQVRTFDGPEVEWSDLLKLADKRQALDIKAAGVCTDWLDCLKD